MSDNDPPRLRDLWPLLAGPLILGGVIFWGAFFVRLAGGVIQRLEVRWNDPPKR